MSIRFVIAANFSDAADEDVLIDAHHISSDGEWFQHPIRAHQLRVGGSIPLLAHIALGFVLHKGTRQELLLCLTHAEPTAHHGLELVVTQVTERILVAPASPPPVPMEVTIAQALTAAHEAGLLTGLQAWIASQPVVRQLQFERILTVRRDSPLFLEGVTRLGAFGDPGRRLVHGCESGGDQTPAAQPSRAMFGLAPTQKDSYDYERNGVWGRLQATRPQLQRLLRRQGNSSA